MEQEHWILIVKSYTKEISDEEKKVLDNWVNSNDKNKLQYKEAKQLLALSENSFETFTPNTLEEWEKFKSKIYLQQETVAIKPIWKQQWFKIAAALLLLFGLGYFIKQNSSGVSMIEVTTANNVKVIYLPDSSSVHLNINSRLIYPNKFDEKERRVTLVGDGYFKVEANPNYPFIVQAANTKISVLGTAFEIKAYEEDEDVEVLVTKGKVAFSAGKTELVLKKQDKIKYNKEKHTYKKSRYNKIDLEWLKKDIRKIEKKIKKTFKKIKKNLHN